MSSLKFYMEKCLTIRDFRTQLLDFQKELEKEGSRRGKGDKKKGLRRDAVVTSDFSIDPVARTAEDIIRRTIVN